MPKVTVAVPHSFDPDQVMERARPYIEKLVDDFEGEDIQLQLAERSGQFSFRSMMFTIHGTIEIDEKQIAVSVDLPFAAMIFKDKVEKAIRKNLSKALDDHTTNPDPPADSQ